MKGQNNRIKNGEHGTNDLPSCKLHQPELLVCTLEGYEGNLADEIASALPQPAQFAELPVVAPEDFESLFSWFIS